MTTVQSAQSLTSNLQAFSVLIPSKYPAPKWENRGDGQCVSQAYESEDLAATIARIFENCTKGENEDDSVEIGLVPSKGGGWRVAINNSNKFVDILNRTFVMQTLKKQQIKPEPSEEEKGAFLNSFPQLSEEELCRAEALLDKFCMRGVENDFGGRGKNSHQVAVPLGESFLAIILPARTVRLVKTNQKDIYTLRSRTLLSYVKTNQPIDEQESLVTARDIRWISHYLSAFITL